MARPRDRGRADELLVERGVAATVEEARARIMTGVVMARDAAGKEQKVRSAGERLDAASTFRLAGGGEPPYVSRGGLKLAAALDAFGLDPSGLVCADFGASTGGFTDCLLQRGAARVHAVDVGYGLIAWKLRTDPRVVLHERTNVRELAPDALGERVALATIDLSFIGLAKVLDAVVAQLAPGAALVALVKPQFEVPRDAVGEGGVVADPIARRAAIDAAIRAASEHGLELRGEVPSPIAGADGNVEHLIHLALRAGEPG